MAIFSQEIYKVVTIGLNTLESSQASGKTPRNPVSEAHYLNAWVTKSIKQQSFDRSVVKTLMMWQQQGRSMGKNAQLKLNFECLAETFSGVVNAEGKEKRATQATLQAFYAALEHADWLITTEFEVNRKVTHFTDGQASLVVCSKQYQNAFDEQGELVKPLSLYVRGNIQPFIDLAFASGLLLFKVTDYKSKVKYHGEFVIYPANNGEHLPELPTRNL
ncbi:DUF2913 family protein [Photobacterium indicum]|uniref:DUF2913 domain-containing protein n=1 Tax=Photobacterium indicum TaxID=81447 RepID=A0A2T3L9A4_9GAMM|nr:DUF2913 family protein [Photobacterium indicum]PSV47576.1 hypothetical protein C9J47_11975 [Photobacterium indicum]